MTRSRYAEIHRQCKKVAKFLNKNCHLRILNPRTHSVVLDTPFRNQCFVFLGAHFSILQMFPTYVDEKESCSCGFVKCILFFFPCAIVYTIFVDRKSFHFPFPSRIPAANYYPVLEWPKGTPHQHTTTDLVPRGVLSFFLAFVPPTSVPVYVYPPASPIDRKVSSNLVQGMYINKQINIGR